MKGIERKFKAARSISLFTVIVQRFVQTSSHYPAKMMWTQTRDISLLNNGSGSSGGLAKFVKPGWRSRAIWNRWSRATLNPRVSTTQYRVRESLFSIGCFELTVRLAEYAEIEKLYAPFAHLLSLVQTTIIIPDRTMQCEYCESIFVVVRSGDDARNMNHAILSSLITSYSRRADHRGASCGDQD